MFVFIDGGCFCNFDLRFLYIALWFFILTVFVIAVCGKEAVTKNVSRETKSVVFIDKNVSRETF